MSLTSLLLGSNAKIDTDLDNLFKVQVPTTVSTTASLSTKEAPKKRKTSEKDVVPNRPKKRAKRDNQKSPEFDNSKGDGSQLTGGEKKAGKKREKQIQHESEYDVDSDSENSDLEKAYAISSAVTSNVVESDGEDPVHETLAKSTKQRVKTTKRKHVPEDETPEMRDRRTIFVGNLPLEVLSKTPLKKQLQRHIISLVPTAKIESIRFRSIPFQMPTSKILDGDDKGDSKTSNDAARAHAKERAADWRSKHGDKEEEGLKADEKKYLTPAQKKRIAYINQEFHASADVVNAYIVFAHPQNASERPANLPPLPPTMDPYQAALQAVVGANGSLFMERMLRVDLVGKVKRDEAEKDEATCIQDADPRLSVFVGNLDFASKEEDLRAFFEGLMTTERGDPQHVKAGDRKASSLTKPLTWVTRVRIVRDNATQLGRGFAYVEFMDKECVDEVLVMEESKLKFAKRKLRVQRCKTVPGSRMKLPDKHSTKTNSKAEKSGRSVRPKDAVVLPKGDPSLGEKLAGLSKEERKKRKSADPDRLARRLAKKKLRMVVPPAGKTLKKERDRVRSKVKRV